MGINPLDYRMKNLLRPGDMFMIEFDTHEMPLDPAGAEECLRRGAEAIGWNRWAHPSTKTGRIRRGLGIYTSKNQSGRGASNGLIWIDRLGKVHLPLSCGNVGTESHTGIAAIAAETLLMPIEQLDVTWGDTSKGPWDFMSDDSRSSHCHGKAVYNAAVDLIRELKQVGCRTLGVEENRLDVRDGRVIVRGERRSMDFRSLAQRAIPRTEFIPFCNPTNDVSPDFDNLGNLIEKPPIRLHKETEDFARKLAQGGIVGLGMYIFNERTVPWGAGFAEVEVDMSTGQVRVIKIVTVMNVGRVLYRRGAEAQLRGGVAIGAGFALMEDLGVDPATGIPIYHNFHEYRPMTVLDYPEIVPILVEIPSVAGPYGAMGLGDNCSFPAPAAIGTAIHNAAGIWIDELPLTLDRVYTALKTSGRLVS
jgi:CO/xanthine dehydrogenase Mo-binding subunit